VTVNDRQQGKHYGTCAIRTSNSSSRSDVIGRRSPLRRHGRRHPRIRAATGRKRELLGRNGIQDQFTSAILRELSTVVAAMPFGAAALISLR
jgi:hypothetical protein